MSVLENLKPQNVFKFFEEISEIPHGSHETKAISDYIVAFAESKGLKYRQEECNNVIIWKDATEGYENSETVMLQGHIDMVCEKEPGCTKDMSKEGLDLFVDGDILGAKGTTLGGDDGIAVAMMLAVLDSDDLCHAPLECLFTVDEEVGMTGAMLLDASDLKAKYLVNIDSEEEGVLTVSCAGSLRGIGNIPVNRCEYNGDLYEISLSGLTSGHSGAEIHIGRANANILLGRVLDRINDNCDMRLVSVDGGTKDNVIPASASAYISIAGCDDKKIKDLVKEFELELQSEYAVTDPSLTLKINRCSSTDEALPMDKDSTDRVICFMYCVTDGIIKMSPEVKGLVQTSSNLGRVYSEDKIVIFTFLMRSSVNTQNSDTYVKMDRLVRSLGGYAEKESQYSAWEYKSDSKLRDVMVEAYKTVYNEEPRVEAIHAGLECGILSGKMPGLDCISFGPDINDIHTPAERLHIASVARTWDLTVETLKQLK